LWLSGPQMSYGAVSPQRHRSLESTPPRFGLVFSALPSGMHCWLSILALRRLATSQSFRSLVTKGTYGASRSHLPSWSSIWSSLVAYRESCEQIHQEIKILETIQRLEQLDWTASLAASGLSYQLRDGFWLLQVPRASQQCHCHPELPTLVCSYYPSTRRAVTHIDSFVADIYFVKASFSSIHL
jgi:hypothetical protein